MKKNKTLKFAHENKSRYAGSNYFWEVININDFFSKWHTSADRDRLIAAHDFLIMQANSANYTELELDHEVAQIETQLAKMADELENN